MNYDFIFDEFLEIELPILNVDLDKLSKNEQEDLYYEAKVRTSSFIPAKILELDKQYMSLYDKLDTNPDDFFEIMDGLNLISVKISALNALFLQIEGYFIQSHLHI